MFKPPVVLTPEQRVQVWRLPRIEAIYFIKRETGCDLVVARTTYEVVMEMRPDPLRDAARGRDPDGTPAEGHPDAEVPR